MNALNFETYFVFHIHYRNSELFNFFFPVPDFEEEFFVYLIVFFLVLGTISDRERQLFLTLNISRWNSFSLFSVFIQKKEFAVWSLQIDRRCFFLLQMEICLLLVGHLEQKDQ